jgi:hypothetical protein
MANLSDVRAGPGSAYARVPQPARLRHVPHLGHMPVPWVTCYADRPFHAVEGPLGTTMGCDCTHGLGAPGLGKQCPTRQRRAMLERRCNVCGTRITGIAIFAGVFAAELDGEPVVITAEAAVHPQCLAYSALVCPGLARTPDDCWTVPVRGAYPLLDQWLEVDGDRKQTHRFMPHDTPRPLGAALDFIFARLDTLPGATAISLADWMDSKAPHEYRALWKEEKQQ